MLPFSSCVSQLAHFDQILEAQIENEKREPGLVVYLNRLQEEWKEVESPITAVYMGTEFGDYFHLIFDDGNRSYDFGDGDNKLKRYKLYDSDFEDNPTYLNRTFLIHWEWKKSNFLCCEGDMSLTTAEVPSILKLKLLD